jgi:thymidylate synthase (FAD)
MKVELLDYFGSDKMAVDVARVSYGKIKENFDEKDVRLIKFLVEHKHTSPFRHAQLQFRIQCPIYVERQLFKHQVGWSANSISGRYVDFSDSYELPKQLRYQSKDSKQGSAGDIPEYGNTMLLIKMRELIEKSKDLYEELVQAGVSKEQCRIILPLCLETTFVWTGSMLAFLHLCELRLKPDAQKETRDVVEEMLEQVKSIEGNPFEHTIAAFGF